MYRLLNHLLYISFEAKHSTSGKSDSTEDGKRNALFDPKLNVVPCVAVRSAGLGLVVVAEGNPERLNKHGGSVGERHAQPGIYRRLLKQRCKAATEMIGDRLEEPATKDSKGNEELDRCDGRLNNNTGWMDYSNDAAGRCVMASHSNGRLKKHRKLG
ncbi:hypothetical protein NL676_024997 [Syzygium grande]|nr:hypothetical protein NL676_024997 [Syzygium grande]